jgi:hypothetical protein
MTISLPINNENFNVVAGRIAGDEVFLVTPKGIGAKFTKDDLIFRSSVWTKDGKPVSLSLKKFFNLGERPDIYDASEDLRFCEIIEKIDGSLLCVSKYKGETIIRTRGTLSAFGMPNAADISALQLRYPKAFEMAAYPSGTCDYSLIFEWYSPSNKIVISYGDEPELFLIGCVSHEDYSLYTQSQLDAIAAELGVRRPKRYKFDTLAEMKRAIGALDYQQTQAMRSTKDAEAPPDAAPLEGFAGMEGFCVYSRNGQKIAKVKSATYLCLHRMKSELSSFDKVLDLWLISDSKNFNDFYSYVCTNLDFEIAEMAKPDMSKVADAAKQVDGIIAGMSRFVETRLRHLSSRKEQALAIQSAYSNTNRASFVFAILDGKDLTIDQKRKLYWQVIKK